MMHWTSLYKHPALAIRYGTPGHLTWDCPGFLRHHTWDPPARSLLLTSGGHHWRPVQTCSFEEPTLRHYHLVATKSRKVGKRAVRIPQEYFLVTAHKRSLGQGNVFTPVCHSVHRGALTSQHASQVT